MSKSKICNDIGDALSETDESDTLISAIDTNNSIYCDRDLNSCKNNYSIGLNDTSSCGSSGCASSTSKQH